MTLSNDAVAVLCDVAQGHGKAHSAAADAEMARLLADGFIERKPDAEEGEFPYRISAKGELRLGELGVGLNEG